MKRNTTSKDGNEMKGIEMKLWNKLYEMANTMETEDIGWW